MEHQDLSQHVAAAMEGYIPKEIRSNYDEYDLLLFGGLAQLEVEAYCNRVFSANDVFMITIMARIGVLHLNRVGTEGITSQSYSGVSENYIDGYPADIQAALNRKRKIKVVG